MEEFGVGAGMAAIAFWGFIAAVVFATYWDASKKRETQQETLRRVIESGREIDEELVNKLLSVNKASAGRMDRDFKVTALWILPVSPGLAIFGYILSFQAPKAFAPLLGVAALLACLAIGFWVAGKIAERWYLPNQDKQLP
jgi:hypothetical protein